MPRLERESIGPPVRGAQTIDQFLWIADILVIFLKEPGLPYDPPPDDQGPGGSALP
jgi:hypothetical protein